MPWYYLKTIPSSIPSCAPQISPLCAQIPFQKWGIWDVTVGYLCYWYLSTEQKLLNKLHLQWQIGDQQKSSCHCEIVEHIILRPHHKNNIEKEKRLSTSYLVLYSFSVFWETFVYRLLGTMPNFNDVYLHNYKVLDYGLICCSRSHAMACKSMEYWHDIHGLDALLCGEGGLSGRQGMSHHLNPGEWQ